jgi:Flp pilus assembly protein CpaB
MWLVVAWACSAPPDPADPGPPAAPAVTGAQRVPDASLFAEGVVATADLPPGHVLAASDLMLGSVPEFTPDPPTDLAALVGATVREPIFGGEPVRLERLAHPPDGRSGYDALVEGGLRAVALSVPSFATSGVEAGCLVELLATDDPSRRPKVLGGTHHRLLGIDPDRLDAERASVVVAASARAAGFDGSSRPAPSATLVALPLALDAEENEGEVTFEAPERVGPPIAVARRVLLPGIMIRSDDLAEVGSAGLEGLRYAVAWAQVPTQPIYPGELPHPLRLAAAGRGLCTAIPEGMRAVAVPSETPVSPDQVEGLVRVRLGDNVLDDLYVASVDPVGRVVVVFTLPEAARALAVAAASVGARFDVTPSGAQ